MSLRPLLAAAVLLALACSSRASMCQTTTNRSTFLQSAFDANTRFIRKGVPAVAVDAFFRRAIVLVIHGCSCPAADMLDALCIRLRFNGDYTVRALANIIATPVHPHSPGAASTYFPLYNPHHHPDALSSEHALLLANHREELVNFLAPVEADRIPDLVWTSRIFPSEDYLFKANHTVISHACTYYRANITDGDERFVSAKDSVAYALGAVQVVRYANGNVEEAMDMLSEHTRYVYHAAICMQKSGADLPIPIAALLRLVDRSKDLMSKALENLHNSPSTFLQYYQYHLPAPAQMENVPAIGEPPLRMFRQLVDQFSSISSGGIAATFLDFDTSQGQSITVRLTNDLLASCNPYDYFAI